MEELASIWYNVISLNQKTGKRYMTMTNQQSSYTKNDNDNH